VTMLRWGSATDVGLVRDVNQDSLLVAEPLFAVADGMGGHQGGEVASATALEILQGTFGSSVDKDGLLEAVRRANAKVWDKAQLDDSLHGMGTTLTAAAKVVDDDGKEVVAVVNVGDSRTYLLRDGELTQVTSDHSFVEEMVRAGEISADEAESHPKRNILTRALGVEPTVEVDLELIEPRSGDRILLCSDGLVREVGDNQIAGTMRRLQDPDEAARELVAQAKSAGGHDNITVVIVDVVGGDEAPVEIVTSATRKKSASLPPIRVSGQLTVRMLLFVVAVLLLVGVGGGSIVWYARASYFVGLEGQQLVVYQGRPDKFLWFEPTIVERTNVLTSDVLPSALTNLQAGETQSSRIAAEDYVRNLRNEALQARGVTPDPNLAITETTTTLVGTPSTSPTTAVPAIANSTP
jgi:PPM family protein phosphatase